jgi:S1-C subfamily serine protease
MTPHTLVSCIAALGLGVASVVSSPGQLAQAADAPIVEPSIADVFSRSAPAIVQVVVDRAEGSGVSVRGGILTNAHVVDGAGRITLYTSDSRTAEAHVVKLDRDLDLALLSTDLPLPTLDLAPPQGDRIGDQALVVGFPLGLREHGGAPILTTGHLSAIFDDNGRTLVQTDAAINPGNSGGALLDLKGQVIGIVSMVLRGNQAQNIGFAIGADTAVAFLASPASPRVNPVRADPTRIAITADDLGGDWRKIDADTALVDDQWYSAGFADDADGDGHRVLSVGVLAQSTDAEARRVFRRFATPIRGWRSIKIPIVGDATYGQASSNRLYMIGRVGSTVVLVMEEADQALDPSIAASALQTMVDRATAQA